MDVFINVFTYFSIVTFPDTLLGTTNLKMSNRGWELTILVAQYRLKLKKVGKTTRPVRYDLNQIPITI